MTIKFVFLFSRQGKLRLAKWFNSYPEKVPNLPQNQTFSSQEKKKLTRDVISLVLARGPKMCSFIEYKDDLKIVYKRYARYLLVLFDVENLFSVFSSAVPLNLEITSCSHWRSSITLWRYQVLIKSVILLVKIKFNHSSCLTSTLAACVSWTSFTTTKR